MLNTVKHLLETMPKHGGYATVSQRFMLAVQEALCEQGILRDASPEVIAQWLLTHRSDAVAVATEIVAATQRQRMRAHATDGTQCS